MSFSLVQSKAIWTLLVFLLLFVCLSTRKRLPAGVRRLPRLPGIPWIGRIWGIPPSGTGIAWHFASFFPKYGPIFEWQAMGDTHVWIGKDSIARDLLVKRGKVYGDRHELPAAVGVKGGSEILPLMGIGDNVSSISFALDDFYMHTNTVVSSGDTATLSIPLCGIRRPKSSTTIRSSKTNSLYGECSNRPRSGLRT